MQENDKWRPLHTGNSPSARLRAARSMPQWLQARGTSIPVPPPPPEEVALEPEYEVIEFSGQTYSNAPPIQRISESRRNEGKRCDLCGSTAPAVRCMQCPQQFFCLSCDDMYHRHPKRQAHIRKEMSERGSGNGLVRPPLPPKGEPSPAPIPPPRRNKRMAPPPPPSPQLPQKDAGSKTGFMGSLKRMMGGRAMPVMPHGMMNQQSHNSHHPMGMHDHVQMMPCNDFGWEMNRGRRAGSFTSLTSPGFGHMMQAQSMAGLNCPSCHHPQQNRGMWDWQSPHPMWGGLPPSGSWHSSAFLNKAPMATQDWRGGRGSSEEGSNSEEEEWRRAPPARRFSTVSGRDHRRSDFEETQSNRGGLETMSNRGGGRRRSELDNLTRRRLESDTLSNRSGRKSDLETMSNRGGGRKSDFETMSNKGGRKSDFETMSNRGGRKSDFETMSNKGGRKSDFETMSNRGGRKSDFETMSNKGGRKSDFETTSNRGGRKSDFETMSNRGGKRHRNQKVQQIETDSEELSEEEEEESTLRRGIRKYTSDAEDTRGKEKPRANSFSTAVRKEGLKKVNSREDRHSNRPSPVSYKYGRKHDVSSESNEDHSADEKQIDSKLEMMNGINRSVDNAEEETPEEELGPVPAGDWECKHCTFVNEGGGRVCAVCCKTTGIPRAATPTQNTATALTEQMNSKLKIDSSTKSSKESLPKSTEKKRGNENSGKNRTLTSTGTSPPPQSISTQTYEEAGRKLKRTTSLADYAEWRAPKRSQSKQSLLSDTQSLPVTPPKSRSPDKFNHLDTQTDVIQPSLSRRSSEQYNQRLQNVKRAGSQPPEYISTLVQKQVKQGLEMVKLLREAEQQQFSAEDLAVSLLHCGDGDPIVWLQQNWRNMIDTVVTLATNYGHERKENTVGTISASEAREALRSHDGNVWAAVTECVEQRQRKYAELLSRGNFSREDIVTVLTANHGNLEDAYTELNKNQLRPFLMRIWGPPQGNDNDDGDFTKLAHGEGRGGENSEEVSVDLSTDSNYERISTWLEDYVYKNPRLSQSMLHLNLATPTNITDIGETNVRSRSTSISAKSMKNIDLQRYLAQMYNANNKSLEVSNKLKYQSMQNLHTANTLEEIGDLEPSNKLNKCMHNLNKMDIPIQEPPLTENCGQKLVEKEKLTIQLNPVIVNDDEKDDIYEILSEDTTSESEDKIEFTDAPLPNDESTHLISSVNDTNYWDLLKGIPSENTNLNVGQSGNLSTLSESVKSHEETQRSRSESLESCESFESLYSSSSIENVVRNNIVVRSEIPEQIALENDSMKIVIKNIDKSKDVINSPFNLKENLVFGSQQDSKPIEVTFSSENGGNVQTAQSNEEEEYFQSVNDNNLISENLQIPFIEDEIDELTILSVNVGNLVEENCTITSSEDDINHFILNHIQNSTESHTDNMVELVEPLLEHVPTIEATASNEVTAEVVLVTAKVQLVSVIVPMEQTTMEDNTEKEVQKTIQLLETVAEEDVATSSKFNSGHKMEELEYSSEKNLTNESPEGSQLLANCANAVSFIEHSVILPTNLTTIEDNIEKEGPEMFQLLETDAEEDVASSSKFDSGHKMEELEYSSEKNLTNESLESSQLLENCENAVSFIEHSVILPTNLTTIEDNTEKEVQKTYQLLETGAEEDVASFSKFDSGHKMKELEYSSEKNLTNESLESSELLENCENAVYVIEHSVILPIKQTTIEDINKKEVEKTSKLLETNVEDVANASNFDSLHKMEELEYSSEKHIPNGSPEGSQLLANYVEEKQDSGCCTGNVIVNKPVGQDKSDIFEESLDCKDTVNLPSVKWYKEEMLDLGSSSGRLSDANSEKDMSSIPTDSEVDPLSTDAASTRVDPNPAFSCTNQSELIELLKKSLTKEDVVQQIFNTLFASVLQASIHVGDPQQNVFSKFRNTISGEVAKDNFLYEAVTKDAQGSILSESTEESSTLQEKRRQGFVGSDCPLDVETSSDRPSEEAEQEIDNENLFEREVRRLLAEGLVKTYDQAEIAVQLRELELDEEVVVSAVKECSTLEAALSFLQQECQLCAGKCTIKQMISMLECEHKCCMDCAKNYFTLQITERSINDCVCPFCKEPDLLQLEEDKVVTYFSNLDILLKAILKENIHELFQRKLRDRTLMQDPHFKWCIRCSSGFIANPRQKRLICPDCKAITCAKCMKPWEKEHENRTCEEYQVWLEYNDPENQLARHLDENGVTCPSCKNKYILAKGGCMHLTCPQCKHEFCSGCAKPFLMGKKCSMSDYCERLGLHSHHPRNCLFYLRDKEPQLLEKLLQENNIVYKIDEDNYLKRCKVQLLKEIQDGYVEAVCGHATVGSGLCRTHYIEHMVLQIVKNRIDPAKILDVGEACQELRRHGKTAPERAPATPDHLYLTQCVKMIEEEIPLE